MDTWTKLNVKRYQLVAVLDNRTSPICRSLDGKIFDRQDAKAGVTMPLFHCYCRTTTVPYIKGITDDETTRTARDPTTGKSVIVPGDLTYKTWYNQYVQKTLQRRLERVAKEKGIRGKILLNPPKINLEQYDFDEKHVNEERKHRVSRKEAIQFIKQAKVAIERWNGQVINFYSVDGAAYINTKTKIIRTAFKRDEFDDKTKVLIEVIDNEEE